MYHRDVVDTHALTHTHSDRIYGLINDTADWRNARADILAWLTRADRHFCFHLSLKYG